MQRRILFVCLGNICRSPSAEAVMKKLAADRGLADRFVVDSAGTGNWHVGEPADLRMRRAGARRGYDLTSISRQVRAPADFLDFDYLVAMDNQNLLDLRGLDPSGAHHSKLHRMVDFCRRFQVPEVPDPYYGGAAGFDRVLDILEDACDGLLDQVSADLEREVAG